MERDQRKARIAALGRVVRAVRQFRGEHQEPMAARGGLAREELSMVEGGRYALRDAHMRTAIARCVDVPAESIEAVLADAEIDTAALAVVLKVPQVVVDAAVVVPPAKAAQEAAS